MARGNLEKDLSPTELILMRAVWDNNASTTRQIYDFYCVETGKEPAVPTVATYLQRLVEKGYLRKRSRRGQREYQYTALVSKKEIQDRMLKKVQGLFRSSNEFLDRFAGQATLNGEHRKKLRQLAKQLEKDTSD